MRTLAHDIGERLGSGGHLLELRRTAVGQFRLSDALTLDELEALSPEQMVRVLVTPSDMLSHLPMIRLDEARVRKVTTGQSFLLEKEESAGALSRSAVRLCDGGGQLVSVGRVDQAGEVVKPIVVLDAG
jgi:tRNA pseudouridine55 synthase